MQVFSWFVFGKEVWKTKCLHWCKRWRPWKRYNTCRKWLLNYSDSETGFLTLSLLVLWLRSWRAWSMTKTTHTSVQNYEQQWNSLQNTCSQVFFRPCLEKVWHSDLGWWVFLILLCNVLCHTSRKLYSILSVLELLVSSKFYKMEVQKEEV